jgi:hypothetical protein
MPVPATKPVPTGWSREQISRLAVQFGKAIRYLPGGEISPAVEKRLQGRIEYLDWPAWKQKGADTIEIEGPGNFTIYLCRVWGLFNNRFSIAHELGHYVLHSQLGQIPLVAKRSRLNERAEWEANWFAASLLMPETEFRKEHAVNPDPWYLASRFLVSPEAAKVRKKTLKLA